MTANYPAGLVSSKHVTTANTYLFISVRFTNKDKMNEILINRLNNNAVVPNTKKKQQLPRQHGYVGPPLAEDGHHGRWLNMTGQR